MKGGKTNEIFQPLFLLLEIKKRQTKNIKEEKKMDT